MSWAIWITGPLGSATAPLAYAAAAMLESRGIRPRVLDVDEIRRVIAPRVTCTDDELILVCRAEVYMAKLLTEAGVPVIAVGPETELACELIPLVAEVRIERDTGTGDEGNAEPGAEPAPWSHVQEVVSVARKLARQAARPGWRAKRRARCKSEIG